MANIAGFAGAKQALEKRNSRRRGVVEYRAREAKDSDTDDFPWFAVAIVDRQEVDSEGYRPTGPHDLPIAGAVG